MMLVLENFRKKLMVCCIKETLSLKIFFKIFCFWIYIFSCFYVLEIDCRSDFFGCPAGARLYIENLKAKIFPAYQVFFDSDILPENVSVSKDIDLIENVLRTYSKCLSVIEVKAFKYWRQALENVKYEKRKRSSGLFFSWWRSVFVSWVLKILGTEIFFLLLFIFISYFYDVGAILAVGGGVGFGGGGGPGGHAGIFREGCAHNHNLISNILLFFRLHDEFYRVASETVVSLLITRNGGPIEDDSDSVPGLDDTSGSMVVHPALPSERDDLPGLDDTSGSMVVHPALPSERDDLSGLDDIKRRDGRILGSTGSPGRNVSREHPLSFSPPVVPPPPQGRNSDPFAKITERAQRDREFLKKNFPLHMRSSKHISRSAFRRSDKLKKKKTEVEMC